MEPWDCRSGEDKVDRRVRSRREVSLSTSDDKPWERVRVAADSADREQPADPHMSSCGQVERERERTAAGQGADRRRFAVRRDLGPQ